MRISNRAKRYKKMPMIEIYIIKPIHNRAHNRAHDKTHNKTNNRAPNSVYNDSNSYNGICKQQNL